MDGHSTYYSSEMIRIAADEGIILFAKIQPIIATNNKIHLRLVVGLNYLTQPLDKGVFAALKVVWKEVCHRFLRQIPGRVISRYDFAARLGMDV